MWIYCRWLFFVSSGDAYAPFHRSEYFNLSCHCLSHSGRDCIGCRDHQIPQSQGGRNPRKTETRGRTGNRGLRRIAKQKATDDRWLSCVIRGSKLLSSWNKTGEIVGKGGTFCRGRRVTGFANFIGYTGPKRPLRTSL